MSPTYYQHQNRCLLRVLMFRLVLVCCILCVLLLPVEIHRTSVNNIWYYFPSPDGSEIKEMPHFNETWTSAPFRWYHHACPTQYAKAIHVTAEQISDVLNVPRSSAVDETLEVYGRCLARLVKVGLRDGSARDLCFCQRFTEVGEFSLLLVWSTFVLCVQICAVSWSSSNRFWLICCMCGFLFWIGAFLVSICRAGNFFGRLRLPDESKGQNYFELPWTWYGAVVLYGLYGISGLFEFVCYFADDETYDVLTKSRMRKKTNAVEICKLPIKVVDKEEASQKSFSFKSPEEQESDYRSKAKIEKSSWPSLTWPRFSENEKTANTWP